jgi:hypothetical protein
MVTGETLATVAESRHLASGIEDSLKRKNHQNV